MSVGKTTLSLVLLTRNDAAHLTERVRTYLALFSECTRDLELIIVDDASDDATPARANYLAAACEPVMVLRHRHERGYGAALLSGLEVVRGDYLVCLDSGSPLAAGTIRRLLSFLDRYDLVLPDSAASPQRTMRAWLAGWLMPDWGSLNLRAPTCRVLLGRTDLLRSLSVRSQSAWIYLELFRLAQQRGAACVRVDVSAQDSGATIQMRRYAQPLWATLRDLIYARHYMRGKSSGSDAHRPVWQQKTTLGAAAALVVGGVWFLWRRRG